MVKIAVNGASGRMGKRIVALAKASKEYTVAGEFDVNGEKLSAEALKKLGRGVLIDFSSPSGTPDALAQAQKAGWGLVVGTTGLDVAVEKSLRAASKKIPVVRSSNMGIGINLILPLLDLLCRKIPGGFDIQMTEAHHIHKKDAPSGTALMLADAIAKAKKWDASRTKKEKERIKSIREGEIVGDHSVLFSGGAETIEIRHHAQSRDVFANGSLLAAKFLAKKKTGFYTMKEVLGI